MIKIGTTISSREPDKEEKLCRFVEMGLTQIQVYIEPGTEKHDLEAVKDSGLAVIVHAAHEAHGFNYPRGATEKNRTILEEAFESATYLRASHLILHPGFLTREEWRDYQLSMRIEEQFDALTKWIAERKGPVRVLVENMPRWSGNQESIFATPLSPFYQSMKAAGFGFCLDLANVGLTQNCYPEHMYDPPDRDFQLPPHNIFILNAEGIAEPLDLVQHETRFKEGLQVRAVADFLKLEPEVIHTRGIDLYDLRKHPRSMSTLNSQQFDAVFPYAIGRDVPIIIETTPKFLGEAFACVKEHGQKRQVC